MEDGIKNLKVRGGMFLILFFLLFSSTSFSQWWKVGGNLTWPYGDVGVTNGDFNVTNGRLSVDYTDLDSILSFQNLLDNTVSISTPSGKIITPNAYFLSGSTIKFNIGPSAFYDDSDRFFSNQSSIYINDAVDTIPLAASYRGIMFMSNNGFIDNYMSYYAERVPWTNGWTNNQYGFYSDGTHYDLANNAYHFYGKGDYPSYFGGTVIQKVYTNDVSNPPTKAELDAAFPNAQDGETLYIDDNGLGTNFYQVVKKGSNWFIFTGSAAL